MTPSEIATSFFDAAARGDRESMVGLFADDAVLDEPMHGALRGIAAIRGAMSSWPRISNQRLRSVTEQDNTVRMQGTMDAAGYGTVYTELKFTVQDDKIKRLDVWSQ